eukprot:TRINITY_DN2636_c1_g2_i1.p1 TRINITY_DN2636_c1_g2~~TRINITY_DN2636_c1_g2_i1.p1  ORF type:complete len:235 (-),score=69.64 TRINITY_DN2636_c1_g2_i1:667-1371(-)
MSNNNVNATDLSDILYDKTLVLLFREYLHSCWSSENLAFWLAVEEYKHLDENEDSLLISKAKHILQTYLEEMSERQVNIDGDIRLEIINKIESNDLNVNMFNSAQDQIYQIMKTDSFRKFISSEKYRNYRDNNIGPKDGTSLLNNNSSSNNNNNNNNSPKRHKKKRSKIIGNKILNGLKLSRSLNSEEINNNNNNNKALQNRANRTESIAYLEDFFHRRPGVDNPNVVKFVGID